MKGYIFRVGIIHSLVGKNDGVSIVIDQTVDAMIEHLHLDLGNIFFMAAHSSPRFNAETHDIFWHKNEIHKKILTQFSDDDQEELDKMIHNAALEAKEIIAEWVERNNITLLIAHNTSHTYNFITAVALGYFREEQEKKGLILPKVLVWWHDSYFEREIFSHPGPVIRKYLKYLPSTHVDGIAFINKEQVNIGRKYFEHFHAEHTDWFFKNRTVVIPNTCSIPWKWESYDWETDGIVRPPYHEYYDSFFSDVGLLSAVEKRGFSLSDMVPLLQHTRVVPRKKIETAIDFAFLLEQKFKKEGIKKCVVLIVSGHSGDEQTPYQDFLRQYMEKMEKEHPESNVVLIFGEGCILSHRDIIVDKKYYAFEEIPQLIAAYGGLGTYFSEVEGFGNNLLEMLAAGLPVVINRYDAYKEEIAPLGFDIPGIDHCEVTQELVDEAFVLLTQHRARNAMVKKNLQVLEEKLNHHVLADMLYELINNILLTKYVSSSTWE